jgi:hypothetical protein
MRSYDSAEIAHLQARTGIRARLLVWISAKNLTTGLVEAAGFWNGDDDEVFTIGGVARTYHGAGGLLGMDDLQAEVGVMVRTIDVWLATAAPDVINAVRGYDLRLAAVEIHRVLTDPLNHRPIAAPHRIWKGQVDGAPLVTPPLGEDSGRVTLTVASAAIALTRTLSGKYSDASMSRVGGDRMFRYADVSGKVPVYWGEKRYQAAAAAPAPAPSPGHGTTTPALGGHGR